MAWIYSPESWMALATLTVLEIVLGIDRRSEFTAPLEVSLQREGEDYVG